jgi:hypothetical protein
VTDLAFSAYNAIGLHPQDLSPKIGGRLMGNVLDWSRSREMWIRVLEKQTGKGLDHWNQRVRQEEFKDEQSLRTWLKGQGVTGYAETLLVMERFGYPDFMTSSADELIEAQYADRPHLRPIYEAVINVTLGIGPITIQARKTYVSLLTPRRTFARIQPTTKQRVDLGLRLEGQMPTGRLQPSRFQETMKLQISLTSVEEIDAEVLGWLRKAYEENC